MLHFAHEHGIHVLFLQETNLFSLRHVHECNNAFSVSSFFSFSSARSAGVGVVFFSGVWYIAPTARSMEMGEGVTNIRILFLSVSKPVKGWPWKCERERLSTCLMFSSRSAV